MTILLSRPSSSTNRSEEADLAPVNASASPSARPSSSPDRRVQRPLDAIDAAAPKPRRA